MIVANARMMPWRVGMEIAGGRVGTGIAYARIMPENWHGNCRGVGGSGCVLLVTYRAESA